MILDGGVEDIENWAGWSLEEDLNVTSKSQTVTTGRVYSRYIVQYYSKNAR